MNVVRVQKLEEGEIYRITKLGDFNNTRRTIVKDSKINIVLLENNTLFCYILQDCKRIIPSLQLDCSMVVSCTVFITWFCQVFLANVALST